MHSSPQPGSADSLNVIFVHGWACGWQDWSNVTSLLPDSIQIGIVKLPGSPEAISLEGAISLNECAAHIIEYANELDFDRFALIGHSMGARIAIELASNWQERVSHLLLLDGSNVPENPDDAVVRMSNQLSQLGQQEWSKTLVESMMVNNLDQSQKKNIINRASQYSIDVLKSYYYAMAEWDSDNFVSAVDQLNCPVTIFQSTSLDKNEVRQSVTNNPKSLWIDILSTRVPLTMIKLVPNTGHFIMFERPQLIVDWVEEILQIDHDVHAEKSN